MARLLVPLAAVAAAFAVRVIGLSAQGIANYDEAAHLLEARFLRAAFLRHTLHEDVALEGLPLFHGKPLHAALLALAQIVLGDHPWVGGVVSALFGAATVWLVYDLGRRFWNARAGALAAFLLAAMPWSVLYGRMALAEADSSFFVLLAARIQLGGFPAFGSRGSVPGFGSRGGGLPGSSSRGVGRGLLRAAVVGVVSSLAFLANYRWGVLLGIQFLGIEAIGGLSSRNGDRVGASRWIAPGLRIACFAVAGIVPLLLTDALYGLTVLGPLLDRATRPRTYLEDLAHNFGKFEAMGIGLRDPLRLPLFLWTFGGPFLIAGFLAAALAWIARPRDGISGARGRRTPRADRAAAEQTAAAKRRGGEPVEDAGSGAGMAVSLLLGGAPIVLFLFTPCVFPRCLSAALAPWALLCGWGFDRLGGALAARWRAREKMRPARSDRAGMRMPMSGQAGLWIACLALLAGEVLAGRSVWDVRSGYGEAVEWLRRRGAESCVSTQAYALRVYGIKAVSVPESADELRSLAARGERYLLVDNQTWISGYTDTYRALREILQPVAGIPHPAGGSASFVWEAPEETVGATEARSRGGDWLQPSRILIYDLLPR